MAEKSEKATPKKLRDARKKGQVAKSQDFPAAFTFLVAILGTLAFSSFFFQHLAGYLTQSFQSITENIDLEHRGGAIVLEAIRVIFITSTPLLLIVMFIGVLVNFLIIGPVFSMEAMKFDLKRLNPVEGIKQKFKLKVLVELLKSILKISVASIIIYLIVWKMLPEIIMSVRLPAAASAIIVEEFLKKASIQVGLFFIAIAIFDLAFQKRTFAKEMMMEKFEVKQEYKDTEGDPQLKWKRKEMFREIAYSPGPSAAKKARTVITNPTHIAVAISYDEKTNEVPKILTMGQGEMAEKIIKIANENQIPIMRNVDLARTLFFQGKINQYVPKETYQAIAEILKWVISLERAEEEKPEFLR
ncbi:MAG: type III secretion system export apparatus subunit SctU [Chlamydiota bacterium]